MAARGIPRIFVGNVPWTVSRKELREYFSQFGQIQNSQVFFEKETGMSRNFGFIQFANREGYLNSSRETNHFLEGNRLTVTDVNPINMSAGRGPLQNNSVAMTTRGNQNQVQRTRSAFQATGNISNAARTISANIGQILKDKESGA